MKKWNLLEVMPGFGYTDERQLVLLYAKDVLEVLRGSLDREHRRYVVPALQDTDDRFR